MSRAPVQLTDSRIERMLAEEAGPGAPAGLVRDIMAAVETTSQRRRPLVPSLAWPSALGDRRAELLVAFALRAALAISAALVGALLQRRDPPLPTSRLLVYQARQGYADIALLEPATGDLQLVGSVQLGAPLGGQRIVLSADGRRATVSGEGEAAWVQAQLDLGSGTITALDRSADSQHDEVSPAGDRIARLVGDMQQGFALSVVDLDGQEAVRLALPEGATVTNAVAWAPDGSSVVLDGCLDCETAMKAGGAAWHLWLVPLDGSPIRPLVTRPDVPGEAAFAPDGLAVVYGARGLEIVDITSGEVTRLTEPSGESATSAPSPGGDLLTMDTAPAWSPDGRRIAFARRGPGGGIFVVDRDGSDLRRLTTSGGDGLVGDSDPVWSPDGGWIAFTRDPTDMSLGDLWIVPSSGGTEHLLLANATADWGPIPAVLLEASPAPASAMPAPSASPTPPPPASPSAPASPSLPPVGSGPTGGGLLLVWQLDGISGADARTETVFTLDVGRGEKRVLGTLPVTEETCCPETVQWSSDRQRVLLFNVLRPRAIVDTFAGTITPAARPPAGLFKAAVSPRGDRIAWADEVTGRAPAIEITDLAGKRLARLTLPGIDVVDHLSWAPDETAITAAGCATPCDQPEDTVGRLLVVPLDGSASRELTNTTVDPLPEPSRPASSPAPHPTPLPLHSGGYTPVAWSPDGRTIAVPESRCVDILPPDPETRTTRRNCVGRLFIVDVATGDRTTLVEGSVVTVAPRWSPDGTRIAFGRAEADGANPGIYLVDRDGANLRRLADGDEPQGWSPDGKWLVYTRYNPDLPPGTDRAEAWVVPLDGGPAKLVAAPAAAGW